MLAAGCKFSCFFRRIPIERKHAAFESLLQGGPESAFKRTPLATRRKQFDADADFVNGDGREAKVGGRLRIQPSCHAWNRQGRDNCGQDVRLQDNHSSNFGTRYLPPRISTILNSFGTFPSKSFISCVPKPSLRGASAFTASRMMTRASSSMLRPWLLARSRKRRFTFSSRLRTIS